MIAMSKDPPVPVDPAPVVIQDPAGRIVAIMGRDSSGSPHFNMMAAGQLVASLALNAAGVPAMYLWHEGRIMASIQLYNGAPVAVGSDREGRTIFTFCPTGFDSKGVSHE
jgi:hypothetical protein